MSLFSTYEAELVVLAGQAHGVLGDISAARISRVDGTKRVKDLLNECNENLQGMDMEFRNASASARGDLRTRIKNCKELVDKIRVDMLQAEKESKKEALIGAEDEDSVYLDMDNASQDQVMMETVSLMKRGEDHLGEALRTAVEMEDVAVSIGQDLTEQREKMEGMKGRMQDINSNLDRADGLMREMYRRMTFNKIVMGIGVGAVIGAIILVLLKVIVL